MEATIYVVRDLQSCCLQTISQRAKSGEPCDASVKMFDPVAEFPSLFEAALVVWNVNTRSVYRKMPVTHALGLQSVMSQFLSSSEFEKNFEIQSNGTDGSETTGVQGWWWCRSQTTKLWILQKWVCHHLNESYRGTWDIITTCSAPDTSHAFTGAKMEFCKYVDPESMYLPKGVMNTHCQDMQILEPEPRVSSGLEISRSPTSLLLWADYLQVSGALQVVNVSPSVRSRWDEWSRHRSILCCLTSAPPTILAHQSVSLPSVPFFESKFFSNSLEERNCDMTRCRQGIGFGIFL